MNYISKSKERIMYLYCAIDSKGHTIDFYLSQRRNTKAAKRFLKKALESCHARKPRTITADRDKAYPVAIRKLKRKQVLTTRYPTSCEKIFKYTIEQDHRFIKKLIRNNFQFPLHFCKQTRA